MQLAMHAIPVYCLHIWYKLAVLLSTIFGNVLTGFIELLCYTLYVCMWPSRQSVANHINYYLITSNYQGD